MKKITLHGPTVRNDGGYVDAGATLTIGEKGDEISSERASHLVDRGVALSETAAKADATPAAPKRRAKKPASKTKPKAPADVSSEPVSTTPVLESPAEQ